jgi:rSAM/selenodomain-associated transferase 1
VTPRPSLVLFARAPVLGAVKTRLSPPLSPRQVLVLYAAFLEDAAAAYGSSSDWAPVLAAEPDADDPALAQIFEPPWRRVTQAPGDLGVKLTSAFVSEFARGAPSVLAVGSDHPALSGRRIEEAFGAVANGADAAIVPAEDGGYCAIAVSRRVDPGAVFRGVPWSTPRALAATMSNLTAGGREVRTLAPSYDVDRPADLERLRADLEGRDGKAPDFPAATARALREIRP